MSWPAEHASMNLPSIALETIGATAGTRLAFLILAHDDPEHLAALCGQLRDHAVFVHVDAKAEAFPVHRFQGLPNVTMLAERRRIHWADFAMVEATLALLAAALSSGEAFNKYVLLSGSCYPIRPVGDLARNFAEDGGRTYMQLVKVSETSPLRVTTGRHWRMRPLLPPRLARGLLAQWDLLARRVLNKVRSAAKRRIEDETGLQPWFGSQWWAMAPDCAAFVLDAVRRRPELSRAYSTTYAPDEQLIQTIVGNSPFIERTVGARDDHGLRSLYDAPLHLVCPDKGRAFRDDEAAFALIRDSDRAFARKLSVSRVPGLVARINAELLRRDRACPA